MRHLILGFVTLLFAIPLAEAEVLIYTGTIRRIEPKDSYKPIVLKCFIITNPMTGEISVIGYGKIDGAKRRELGSVLGADYYPLDRADASKFELYAFTVLNKEIGVDMRSLFLRGPQKTVTVDMLSGNPVTAQRARTLKGSRRELGIGLGYSYRESEIVVRLDEQRTIDVNVRDRTVAQVREEISAVLFSRGFNL
jgi:hypothetical protein